MNSAISFIIVLGLLIFVHEFGHFLFAKLFRVKVLKFSLGFGPRLIGRQVGETEYVISAFPLGGYVKMLGENPADEVETDDHERAFALKPVWQRFIIVAGGPVFNLLFAALLFVFIFASVGVPIPSPGTTIGSITAGSAAERVGLLAGDTILSINDVSTTEWTEVSNLIKDSNGELIKIVISRQGEELTFSGHPEMQPITNLFGETVGHRLMMGIARSNEVLYEKVGFLEAVQAGLAQTWGFIYLTIMGIIKIIQKVIPASELGGPILIAQIAGKQLETGWLSLLNFIGLVSVNLGILNLFPIPILDGGHLVFFSVEALRKKPLQQKTQEILQQVGLVILASLMLFVFYNDIARLFANS